MKFLADELKAILDSSKGEREIAQFLKENPEVALWSFIRTGGHMKYVLSEFPFGSKYRADLVIPFSYSGAWDIHFIELEPVDDIIITKDGLPSNRLNSAISQIGDWAEYIEKNRRQVQEDLSDWCVNHDLLGWHSDDDLLPSNFTGNKLRSPATVIFPHFHIIIGRREAATEEKRRKMNHYRKTGYISVGTYDRFLDVAQNIDEHHKHPEKSVFLADIKE